MKNMSSRNRKVLIALTGLAGSGKDTVANRLRSTFEAQGDTVFLMSFADPLKEAIHENTKLFMPEPLSMATMYSRDKDSHNTKTYTDGKPVSMPVRTLMQTWGDGYMKIFGRNVFTNALVSRLEDTPADVYIVPDTRYVHDITSLITCASKHSWDLHLIHVIRPGIETMRHRSEQHIGDVCDMFLSKARCAYDRMLIIHNDSTLEWLEDFVSSDFIFERFNI